VKPSSASRGDIWLVNLDPTRGHEQAGVRPAVIVSVDAFNGGPGELVIVIPITTKERRVPFEVALKPNESGLERRSFARTEAVRSIAKMRLIRRIGAAPDVAMRYIEERLRILLDL